MCNNEFKFAAFLHCTQITGFMQNLRTFVEEILGCDLAGSIGITDKIEAKRWIAKFLNTLKDLPATDLNRVIDPQWVVLAAGIGTRIDPSSRLNKNLDIWIGAANTLQMSRRYLPGTQPHIVVINPQMVERFSQFDQTEIDLFLGTNVITCVQPEPNGTGGALYAALTEIKNSTSEFVGVSFGDEPFLSQAMFMQTLISHFIAQADITLCAKVPETVVDKGGLFFDADGRFYGTTEWYDMTQAEQSYMRASLKRGKAYTNTGITLIRRQAMIERMDRLKPHKSGTELHHVDLVRLFYEDGLSTNAHIYRGEVVSGVNRWSNVLIGENMIYETKRQQLAQQGVRVDPSAQITLENDATQIGIGCHFLGKIHLGQNAVIGDYCRLENVVLTGNCIVGDLVGLKNVTANDTIFEANPVCSPITEPILGLAVQSQIENSKFNYVKVGHKVDLHSIQAFGTVIPPQISLRERVLGVPVKPKNWWFDLLVDSNYKPGIFAFGEKKHLPDWKKLRDHIRSHSENELIARSIQDLGLRQIAVQTVVDLLNLEQSNSTYITDQFTAEEVWGAIFEMVKLSTGKQDPYRKEKLAARQTAYQLIQQFQDQDLDWLKKLKLVIAGNLIDYSNTRVVNNLNHNPNYFEESLQVALSSELSINCFRQFQEYVIDASPKRLVWLIDNDGESVFDMWFIEQLAELGHQVVVVGKKEPASNDTTLADLYEIASSSAFQRLRDQMQQYGHVSFITSGSATIGTNLNQATPEFANVLLDADIVIAKGQGNFFTTQGLKKDIFYLLLSKGITAEESTGVIADRSKAIDGLILGYVPANIRLEDTLKDYCQRQN